VNAKKIADKRKMLRRNDARMDTALLNKSLLADETAGIYAKAGLTGGGRIERRISKLRRIKSGSGSAQSATGRKTTAATVATDACATECAVTHSEQSEWTRPDA